MKVKTTLNESITFILPSLIFNNKSSLRSLFPFIAMVFILPIYHANGQMLFAYYYLCLLVSLGLAFFLSPRHLVLSHTGIRFHYFLNIKWSDLKGFALNGNILTILTTDNKEHVIRIDDVNDMEAICDLLENKINGLG